MKQVMRAAVAALAVGAVLAAAPLGAATSEQLAQEVRAAETAFAKAMASRDFAAFTSHLADEAVFFGAQSVQRGKDEVMARWKLFFEGPDAPFSWEPEQVEVLDSGNLGISSGPVRDPAGKRVGTFNTIWRREADGHWRVIFDKGCPPCPAPCPATSEGAK